MPLPAELGAAVRGRLWRAHAWKPFSAVDPRETVQRVARILEGLALTPTVYRGSLGLPGADVDHLWLDVEGRVVDVSFPVLEDGFVDLLRRFAAGEAEPEALADAAARATLDRRVVGEFPESLRYIGAPVWGARGRG